MAARSGLIKLCRSRLPARSVEQIDRTYGYMVPESEDYLRGLLDAFDEDAPRALAVEN